jgi:hypothetical protein
MDKRLIQGQLMNEHRMILNEISDIRSNTESTAENDKLKIKQLEIRLKVIAEKLYHLYK